MKKYSSYYSRYLHWCVPPWHGVVVYRRRRSTERYDIMQHYMNILIFVIVVLFLYYIYMHARSESVRGNKETFSIDKTDIVFKYMIEYRRNGQAMFLGNPKSLVLLKNESFAESNTGYAVIDDDIRRCYCAHIRIRRTVHREDGVPVKAYSPGQMEEMWIKPLHLTFEIGYTPEMRGVVGYGVEWMLCVRDYAENQLCQDLCSESTCDTESEGFVGRDAVVVSMFR